MVALVSHPRPVIGICGGDADSASVRAMMTQVASSGAIPLFLGNHAARNAAKDLEKIDALIVMGNNKDIDPARYGQPAHEKTEIETATPEGKARADYEYTIIAAALAQGIPYLGVCGGMQRLNVLQGGDLYQHVPELVGNDDHQQNLHNIAPFIPVQVVHLEKDSKLAHIGDTLLSFFTPWHKNYDYNENSMHHQAVHTPGRGLRPAAYSNDLLPDGTKLIEAIEADPDGPLKNQFVLGVQWHPEFSASELGAKIANRMVEEAQNFAIVHKRVHPPGEAQDENIFSNLPVLKTPAQPVVVAPGGWVEKILRVRLQNQQPGPQHP